MSSLMEKLKAAKAMQAELAEHTRNAETELKAKVEEAPEVEELSSGPAPSVNNQESPMAKLRAKMAAKKAAAAEPKEATQAADSLKSQADSIAERYKATGQMPTDDEHKILLRENASRAKELNPKPVNDWKKPVVDADTKQEPKAHPLDAMANEEESAPEPMYGKPKAKLSLKEKLAQKKAMQEKEQHAKVITHSLPKHSEPTHKPEPRPMPVKEHKLSYRERPNSEKWPGMARIKAQREAREAAEREAKHSATPEPERETSKPEQMEEKPKATVKAEGGGLLERLRAKREANKAALNHAPEVSSEAVDKSMESFQQTQLPAQPTDASPKSMARVEVEKTGIQGSPQVKDIEEKAAIAANRQAVTLNAKQDLCATRYVDEEQSCVMIGAAGTGKTTGVRGVLQRLLDTGKLEYNADYKRQGGGGLKDRMTQQPNVAVCAFTRRAAINIMESITSQPGLEVFKWCCQTVHNLLEFAPEYYDAYDDETGEWVNKMRFCPHRHADNKIDCDWLIIEEASMVDLNLWDKLLDALRPGTRILFLGDINQLPPVFGLPILVYAMFKLPVIELTEVYRQSVGPVLRNAHNVLKGMPVEEQEEGDQAFLCYEEYKTDKGSTSLKKHSADKGSPIMAGETKMSSIYTVMFRKLFEAGRYDPEQDMIISPFNVGDLGTLHMNQCLAQFIGDARDAVVNEIIAGFHKHYLAIGDKVMVERQDGYITSINHNSDYMGSLPKQAGNDLSRFGVRILGRNAEDVDLDEAGDVNFNLDAIGEKTAEELKRAASHIVTVTLESGEEVVLANSGQFAPEKFTLGYCITGHKSQGSEWRNVYIIMHKKHHSLLTREWLYTTVTRARKQCTLLCKPFSVEKALASQRISGDTIEDKLAWFTSGAVDNLDEIQVTK